MRKTKEVTKGVERRGKRCVRGEGVKDVGAEAEMEGVGSNTKDEELVRIFGSGSGR